MSQIDRPRRRWPLALEVLGAALATLVAAAAYSWKARVAGLLSRLRQRPPGACAIFDSSELGALPEPVARYFRAVLRDGQPIVRHAILTQRGNFRVRMQPPVWRPFVATEAMTVGGFVWDARVGALPGIQIRVCDWFVAGSGSMRASAMGIWPLVRTEGTPGMASGALLRYLAEAVWMPTALLPSQGVIWSALDRSSARATITCAGATAALDFHFDDDGLVRRVFTNERCRDVDGAPSPTPWQARFWDYADVHGMRIPLRAEVEWLLPHRPQPYWQGRITAAAFEYEVKAV